MKYREVSESDLVAIAALRATAWGTPDYWLARIRGYRDGSRNPQQARPPRILWAAFSDSKLAGFIAGHQTDRFGGDAELQWLHIDTEYRQQQVATQLLFRLADWFAARGWYRVFVNVEPDNTPARRFYQKHGAEAHESHWMVWADIREILPSQSG